MSEWIEHDGMGYPVPVGTRVSYRYADGEGGMVTIKGRADIDGFRRENGDIKWSPWYWGRLVHIRNRLKNWDKRIIAYRIINDGEESKREARSELFKKMIEGVAPVGGEPKLPAPKKKVKVSG